MWLFLICALVPTAAIRRDQETVPFCWNCCASSKCSQKSHRTRYFGKASFLECEPVPGVYKKEGQVVTPEMVQEGAYFGKASYLCEEKCWMTLEWTKGQKSKGSVFRAGGVDGGSCVYESVDGLKWKKEEDKMPEYKPKKYKKTWEQWFLEQGIKDAVLDWSGVEIRKKNQPRLDLLGSLWLSLSYPLRKPCSGEVGGPAAAYKVGRGAGCHTTVRSSSRARNHEPAEKPPMALPVLELPDPRKPARSAHQPGLSPGVGSTASSRHSHEEAACLSQCASAPSLVHRSSRVSAAPSRQSVRGSASISCL
ncbi:unnamed protein product, partial [Symbiodinium pilosum]